MPSLKETKFKAGKFLANRRWRETAELYQFSPWGADRVVRCGHFPWPNSVVFKFNWLGPARERAYKPCQHHHHDDSPNCRQRRFINESIAPAEKLKLDQGGYRWWDDNRWGQLFCLFSCSWGNPPGAQLSPTQLTHEGLNLRLEQFGRYVNRFDPLFINYLEHYRDYNPGSGIDNPVQAAEAAYAGGRDWMLEPAACRQGIDSLQGFFRSTRLMTDAAREEQRRQAMDEVVQTGQGQIPWTSHHAHSGACDCSYIGHPTKHRRYRALYH